MFYVNLTLAELYQYSLPHPIEQRQCEKHSYFENTKAIRGELRD